MYPVRGQLVRVSKKLIYFIYLIFISIYSICLPLPMVQSEILQVVRISVVVYIMIKLYIYIGYSSNSGSASFTIIIHIKYSLIIKCKVYNKILQIYINGKCEI